MRTKLAMMVALAVVLAALLGSAGTALAPQVIGGGIHCQTKPCVATGNHQVLFEQVGDGVSDKMVARAGYDHLDARAYTDDRDVAKGNGGHDLLLVNDGDAKDWAVGGLGYDRCVVDTTTEAAASCEQVIVR